MLPLGDDNSARRTVPVVTYVFIAINVVVFLLELSAGDAFIERWSVVPARLLANPVGDFITVFTAMFMHGGWMHLLSNMLYLWIFGDNVEDRLGQVKFIIFYLLCGIVATFAQVLVNPDSNIPNLGASGAIAGVLGAYLLMFPRGSVRVLMGRAIIPMPALIVIGFWALLQVISGVGSIATTAQTADTGGVAYMAHVGGFVAGLILTPLMGGTRQQPQLLAS
ncbi:MAG TPA: rhomboid family intramembrane serine protease [Anaerolineales bacterium]|nr:rhomboid family intramembrane serine protease [Anaerolineales bacterium]